MIQEYQLRVLPEVAANEQQLKEYLVQEKGLNVRNINATRILKRSIDARQRTIFVNLNVRVYLNEMPKDDEYQPTIYKNVEDKPQVIVVGAGPGGLFAALRLIELGLRPIIVERGKNVRDRKKDLAQISREHTVNPISPDDKQAVMMLNAEAMFSMVDNLMTGVRILIWMVGLGTLFAGAIGVSNIMMVTVRERTTEIGIRRAIGARPRDILQQILSESMVLTTIAGMAGISFAVLVLQVLEAAANDPGHITTHYQVSFGLAIGTCALLIALGVLAGLAPAYRAMAIKPIEAIRDE